MLKDKLQSETIIALKAKLSERLSTLRMINAKIKDQEINNRVTSTTTEVTDSQIITLIAKMIKQSQDSVIAYQQANRQDLVKKEEAEIKILKEFMPQALSEEAIDKAIAEAILAIKPSGQKDMGKVINYIKAKYVGQDMSIISQKIKQILNS